MTLGIEFPPTVDVNAVLGDMNSSAFRHTSAERRRVTQDDPLRFALTYLTGGRDDGRPNHLASRHTGGRVSFSQMHIDMYKGARRWGVVDDPPIREGWVAPRNSAKSTTMFLALPLWALAHGRVGYVMAFADAESQAKGHLANMRRELEGNSLLRQDYPELRPAGTRGSRNSALDLDFAGGASMSARGMDSRSLGAKSDADRPDLLICHAAGTLMLDAGEWSPVEQHESFRGFRNSPGREVRVWGLPSTETVTPEHRYWCKWVDGRRSKSRPATWVEAVDLESRHYIGTPIDMTESPTPGWAENVHVDGASRDTAGRVHGAVWEPRIVRPDRFDDPEFWWLVGYWWGNGHLGSPRDEGPNYATVGVTAPLAHPEYAARVQATATGRVRHISRSSACETLQWSDAPLARWLRTWKTPGAGQAEKCPPGWVERLPLDLQRALVAGYTDADGDQTAEHEVRVTSIWLPSLLMLRRIQARLGVAVTIRKGPGPRLETFPDGHQSRSKQKYDARWSLRNDRYSITRTHIADGMLWSKVREVSEVETMKAAPIRTTTGDYVTAFGLSHNCDDMEPPGSVYSPELKAKRLATLLETILPMNDRAVVQLVGTVTMFGAIMHDFVQAALGEDVAWIREEGFRPRYYPPIRRLRDGSEESCWPARWSLADLKAKRDAGGRPGGSMRWRMAFSNQPPRPGEDGVGWRESMFRWGKPRTDRPKMFVDVAVTSKRTSDQSAITVMAPTMDGRKVVVFFCRGYRITPAELRDEVHRVAKLLGVDEVFVEVNNGQDFVLDRFRPMPAGIQLKPHRTESNKEVRLMDLLDQYERTNVIHADKLTELEAQLLDHHPKSKHDDLADVISIGVGKLLKGSVRL